MTGGPVRGRNIAAVNGGPEPTGVPRGDGPGAGALDGKVVVVVSPHFDDVPLSLGQSLLDGALSRAASVRVKVVFGRSNWSVKLHPTRRRAPLVTGWRRVEETLAARRFGYRFEVSPFEEVILRTGSTDASTFRGDADPTLDPLFAPVVQCLRRWRSEGDELWVPSGLGRHVDHRIVAMAGARMAAESPVGPAIAFYEDRPYVSLLDEADRARQRDDLGLDLRAEAVSGPISASTQALVRRSYRSQMDEYFEAAQRADLEAGSVETIWRPAP